MEDGGVGRTGGPRMETGVSASVLSSSHSASSEPVSSEIRVASSIVPSPASSRHLNVFFAPSAGAELEAKAERGGLRVHGLRGDIAIGLFFSNPFLGDASADLESDARPPVIDRRERIGLAGELGTIAFELARDKRREAVGADDRRREAATVEEEEEEDVVGLELREDDGKVDGG